MAIDFPSTGLVAGVTTYTSGSRTWVWNGTAWDSTGTNLVGTAPISYSNGTISLATSGVTAGTYNNSATQHTPLTIDTYGRITATGAAVTITPAWGSITSIPAQITGITGLLSTGTGLLKNTAGTWSYDNSTYITASSPTITTPTIDTVNTSLTTTGTAALWNTGITTGTISIGGALTTGTINIATGGTSATNINLGHTNALIGLTGNTTVTGTIAASGLAGSLLSSASPLINGTAAAGTSAIPSRQDHVHPTDTSRAATNQTFFIGTQQIAINQGTGTITALPGVTSVNGTTIPNAATLLTSTTGVTTVNGSSGAISNVAVTNANNNFSTAQTVTGALTATSIVKSGGTASQYLMADGSVTSTVTLPDIIPLDNLQYKFDGIESRFLPTYQGVTQAITNPFRLLISINGIIQSISLPEYVWGTPFTMDGFMVDSDGYLAFSEVPPAGSTFFGTIQAGPTTQSSNNIYPFRAMDILLGAY